MRPTDITTQAEYDAVLDILPGRILDLVAGRIHQVEEIVLDKGQNLKLKVDGLRLKYPVPVTENGLIDSITVRVARAIMGVAEPLRSYIEAAHGLCVIGPPAVGKTTLLRDIARIRGEQLGPGASGGARSATRNNRLPSCAGRFATWVRRRC